MRKHNEGYSMVLVLVVLTVICLVATGLMSYSLSNLENQRRAVTLMEEEYELAGEIEQYVIKLEQTVLNLQPEGEVVEGLEPTYRLTADDLSAGALNVTVTPEEGYILVASRSETTEIRCKIVFIADGAIWDETGYKLKNCTGIACQSYEISRGVAQE